MNYEETILVSLNLSNSWQSIRPSYSKILIPITTWYHESGDPHLLAPTHHHHHPPPDDLPTRFRSPSPPSAAADHLLVH